MTDEAAINAKRVTSMVGTVNPHLNFTAHPFSGGAVPRTDIDEKHYLNEGYMLTVGEGAFTASADKVIQMGALREGFMALGITSTASMVPTEAGVFVDKDTFNQFAARVNQKAEAEISVAPESVDAAGKFCGAVDASLRAQLNAPAVAAAKAAGQTMIRRGQLIAELEQEHRFADTDNHPIRMKFTPVKDAMVDGTPLPPGYYVSAVSLEPQYSGFAGRIAKHTDVRDARDVPIDNATILNAFKERAGLTAEQRTESLRATDKGIWISEQALDGIANKAYEKGGSHGNAMHLDQQLRGNIAGGLLPSELWVNSGF